MRWGRFHVATWLSTAVAVICLCLYVAALALPRWSKQSLASLVVLGSGDGYYGPFQVCVQSANVRTCASVDDTITGGATSQSMCDILNKYSYCPQSKGVAALVILAIFSCGSCAILIGNHLAQLILHCAASVFGLVAMSLWLNIQYSMNKDTTSSNSLSLDLCEGLVIFCWLVNASAAVLSAWGGRGVHVIPVNVMISSTQA